LKSLCYDARSEKHKKVYISCFTTDMIGKEIVSIQIREVMPQY